MNKENDKLLEKRIKEELEALPTFQTGSKEKSQAIDDLVQLYKLDVEQSKLALESGLHHSTKEKELKCEHNKLKEQRKDRYVKLGIDVTSIIVPIIFYGLWMKKGLQFEEKGTYTSTTFKGLFNRFKPTK